jgi:two-component system chemotaxis response regulator CheY
MSKILIADDTQFWREIAGAALRRDGHAVISAEDGLAALTLLQKESADLIILDVQMPKLEGFGFLEHIRRYPEWKNLPVIMLTSDMHKEHVLRAKSLGAVDYLLKTGISLTELVDRVQKRLGKQSSSAAAAEPDAPHGPITRLLQRDESLERVRRAMAGQTISGVVAQIIATAMSPQLDLSDLARMIGHDAVLSARVLQSANSVANASNRGVITTLDDAVRVVGCSTVRDIAASVGVFEAMPAPEPDGFDHIRCWQHSIAVANLCNRLAPESLRGSAYLIGLCHDLGEILFRTHFGAEYREVLAAEQHAGQTRQEVERHMLGITHGELVQTILQQFELPEAIQRPILDFHAATEAGVRTDNPMARLLQVADAYSSGLLLGASDQATVRPLTKAECRAATGQPDPSKIPGPEFRAEIYTLTAQYAQLSKRDQARMLPPQLPAAPGRIWLARDPAFSALDPIAAAVESIAEVVVENRFPTASELADCTGLIVVGRNITATGFSVPDLAKSITPIDVRSFPILWLTAPSDDLAMDEVGGIKIWKSPLRLRELSALCAMKEGMAFKRG